MNSRKCLQLLILFFLFLVFLITHTFPRSVAESLRKITNFELRPWLFQWLQEELISKLFLCKAIYLNPPGTTHRVRQVRQPPCQNFFIVSSVLVGVEKNFTFCTFEWIINSKFQAKRLIHKGLFMIIVLFVSLA